MKTQKNSNIIKKKSSNTSWWKVLMTKIYLDTKVVIWNEKGIIWNEIDSFGVKTNEKKLKECAYKKCPPP